MNGARLINRTAAAIGTPDFSDHQKVDLSIISNKTTVLSRHEVYRIWSSVDCFVRLGDSTVTAATTDMPLTAKIDNYWTIDLNFYIAAIVSAGTGALYITRVK